MIAFIIIVSVLGFAFGVISLASLICCDELFMHLMPYHKTRESNYFKRYALNLRWIQKLKAGDIKFGYNYITYGADEIFLMKHFGFLMCLFPVFVLTGCLFLIYLIFTNWIMMIIALSLIGLFIIIKYGIIVGVPYGVRLFKRLQPVTNTLIFTAKMFDKLGEMSTKGENK